MELHSRNNENTNNSPIGLSHNQLTSHLHDGMRGGEGIILYLLLALQANSTRTHAHNGHSLSLLDMCIYLQHMTWSWKLYILSPNKTRYFVGSLGWVAICS